jgi:hypothetical protein
VSVIPCVKDMWLYTKFGFFSIVQKPNDDFLTVRSRSLNDLELFAKEYLKSPSAIESTLENDYPYRLRAWHDDVAQAIARAVLDIDYDNFKGVVAQQDFKRYWVYSKVHDDTIDIELNGF